MAILTTVVTLPVAWGRETQGGTARTAGAGLLLHPAPTLGTWKPCNSAAHSFPSTEVRVCPAHGLSQPLIPGNGPRADVPISGEVGGELHGVVHALPPCFQWPGAPCEGSWLASGAFHGSHQALRQLGGAGKPLTGPYAPGPHVLR